MDPFLNHVSCMHISVRRGERAFFLAESYDADPAKVSAFGALLELKVLLLDHFSSGLRSFDAA